MNNFSGLLKRELIFYSFLDILSLLFSLVVAMTISNNLYEPNIFLLGFFFILVRTFLYWVFFTSIRRVPLSILKYGPQTALIIVILLIWIPLFSFLLKNLPNSLFWFIFLPVSVFIFGLFYHRYLDLQSKPKPQKLARA